MKTILKLVKINKLHKNIFFVTSLILSLLLMLLSVNFEEFINNKEIYSCNINQNIDYNVKIFPNSIFDKTILSGNKVYISKLVDDINVHYNYNHNSDTDGDLELFYTVTATTLIIENSEKDNQNISEVPSIRKKEHILKDNKNATLSDNIVIDYDTYMKEVEEFKKDIYRLSYSALLLDFKVESVKHLKDESKVSTVTAGNVKIPLDEESFVITTNFEADKDKKYMRYETPKFYINYILLTVACLILVIDFILFYFNKRFYYKYYLKSPKKVKLEKFLFEFNDVIFISKEKPEIINKNKIFLNEFFELSNLYHLIKQPVIYYKEASCDNIMTNYFYMDHNNTTYIFVFKI